MFIKESMIKDKLTKEQLANLDKLNFFYDKKINVHILLLRKNNFGKNIFLNGSLISKENDTLFILNERVLGEVRVSLYEIRENGVEDEKQ